VPNWNARHWAELTLNALIPCAPVLNIPMADGLSWDDLFLAFRSARSPEPAQYAAAKASVALVLPSALAPDESIPASARKAACKPDDRRIPASSTPACPHKVCRRLVWLRKSDPLASRQTCAWLKAYRRNSCLPPDGFRRSIRPRNAPVAAQVCRPFSTPAEAPSYPQAVPVQTSPDPNQTLLGQSQISPNQARFEPACPSRTPSLACSPLVPLPAFLRAP
jgi:hypothetical protein